MNIKKGKNKLFIDNIEKEFSNDIDTVLEFSNYCIVLLMNDDVPDNNIIAIGYDGNIVWNISEIVDFNYPEAYITISKENENTVSVVTYNGVKFFIDTLSNQIIKKEITK